MSIHVALHHRTHYQYGRPITIGPQIIRLRPAPHCRTRILSYSLRISPGSHFINWQQDPQSNYLARLVFPEKSDHFTVEVDLVAEMAVYNPFDFFLEPWAERMPFTYPDSMRHELSPFLKTDESGPLFEELVGSLDLSERLTTEFLVDLNQRLYNRVQHITRLEPGIYTSEETLAKGEGSCRDTGWLLVRILRHLGYAARFVSGYLIQLKPDMAAIDGPSGAEEDSTDLHAWAEVYLPGGGWIGLDPTSGLLAGEGHIPLACTPEPRSAAPISGTMEEAAASFDFEMAISRLAETPRVTKPYTEQTWAEINELGKSVDDRLAATGLEMAMSSKPTFVLDPAAPDSSPRAVSEVLLKRLRECLGAEESRHGDSGLEPLAVTPELGFIAVDLPLSENWPALATRTELLYEEARQAGLAAETFMLDGRHTGTGGGNAVVLGGPTGSQSPLLKRPDLLKSLLAYWQHHPSLSYVFSGLCIGPESLTPRADEARPGNLRELEAAFRELDRLGPNAASQPSAVHQIFRHLLTDPAGNTQHAEFVIDQLHPADDTANRQDRLKLASFDMLPHARMSLTPMLLLRGLITRFLEHPYEQADRLVDWGSALHDRWMLPYFLMEDLNDVVTELRRGGMPFDADWFAPHREFRFPRYGAVNYRGIEIELRQALEPCQVLVDKDPAGGVARFIDSSVERLQVKVSGFIPERYMLTCNGRTVPLRKAGQGDTFVAGVRYRAWEPERRLHPTIGVDAPLVFDLFDTWNDCSLGGCTYHATHPGGRSYETFPVNANEAESRRLSRFLAQRQTPGRIPAASSGDGSKKFPYTLDLRQPDA